MRLLTMGGSGIGLPLSWLVAAAAQTPSSDCCYSALLGGDPHVIGAHGDKFSVRGQDQGIFNLLSAPNISLSGQFEVSLCWVE